ncbi:hypothetical protein H6G26_40240 [Nostoc sp. FACHB-888]|nr:hypothetical protein [Nostoc sp. FACHB-888]
MIKPQDGETPEAIAIPMHKGRATRNTTNDAGTPLVNEDLFLLILVISFSIFKMNE